MSPVHQVWPKPSVSNLSVFSTAIFVSVVNEWCVCVCVCVCVHMRGCACLGGCVSVAVAIVKSSVFPLSVEDGCCRNFLYHYYHYYLARHSERGKQTRQIEKEVGRQHLTIDRPSVC